MTDLIRFVILPGLLLFSWSSANCLPVLDAGAVQPPTPLALPADDILRQFNISREEVAARQQEQRAAHSKSPASSSSSAQQHPSHPELSSAQQAIRISAANLRKQAVFQQVMGYVSQHGRPPQHPFQPQPATAHRPSDSSGGTAYHQQVGRVRYVLPSCDIPKHTEEEAWSSATSTSLHLFFNLTGIQAQVRPGNQLFVVGAKLRLFKLAEGEDHQRHQCGGSKLLHDLFDQSPSDEEKVRISVHNYTRALKRHRAHKKKLLDSQMALAKEEGHMELDVKPAARWWLTVPGGRNFGLSLEVEDADGQKKQAGQFFRLRDCSHQVTGDRMDVDVLSSPPTDPSALVLELTVAEVPEGRNVLELPPTGHNSDSGAVESDAIDDEVGSGARQLRYRPHQHEEQHQSDEAAQHHQAATGRPHHHRRGHHHHHGHRSRSFPAVLPTLATLEDHDLFRETEEEEAARAEADEQRMMTASGSSSRIPSTLFMQRMLASASLSNKQRKRMTTTIH